MNATNFAILRKDVQIAKDAYEVELLFAGFDENAADVRAAYEKLVIATSKLNRAEVLSRENAERAESYRIAAKMAAAPTHAEAMEILRKANAAVQDQRADAQYHIETTQDPQGDEYPYNEDGFNSEGRQCIDPYFV